METRTNIRHLQHFLAVLEHRSFSSAAKTLNIAQPSVTRSVKLLEELLGYSLFERTTRYVIPTSVGLQFGRTVRSVLAELSAEIENIQALSPNHISSVRIDGSPIVGPRLFPKAIFDMANKHPQYRVMLDGPFDMQFERKLRRLSKGSVDLIVSIARPDVNEDNIVRLSLLRPELRVVVARSNRSCDVDTARISDLNDMLWIMPKRGTEPYDVVENEFTAAGLDAPARTFHMENWDTALSFVRNADAICALPYHPACFGRIGDEFKLSPIRFRVDPIRIDIYVRSTYERSPSIMAFIEVLKMLVQESEQENPDWRS